MKIVLHWLVDAVRLWSGYRLTCWWADYVFVSDDAADHEDG